MDPAGNGQTPGGGTGAPGGRPAATASSGRLLGAVVAVVGLLVVGLFLMSGVGAATLPVGLHQSDDVSAPELGNLTKVDLTTVELEIKDDSGVNTSAIETADFQLSAGNVSGVSTEENGTDALVTVDLEAPIDDDQLQVTIAEGHNVTDEAGNELGHDDASRRRAYGMDGQAPTVSLFTVDDGEGGEVRVNIEASESLDGITVALDGPASVEMDHGDFNSPAAFDEYEGSITPPASGEYDVTLETVTDDAGNTREVNETETVTVDVTPPDARARIDYANSQGLGLTFDASHSTDNELIQEVTWDLGDGVTATGERVTHEYEPGNYTVTATATDHAGNVGTDELLVNLTGETIRARRSANATGARNVTITGGGTDSPTAMIDVTDAEARVAVPLSRDVGDGTPIAAGEVLALQALAVELGTDASYGLGLQIEEPASVSDITAATDSEPLAALTVIHDVSDENVENVTFEFGLDRASVDDAIGDPDAVALFRFDAGEWQRLATERHNGTGDGYSYRADSPGLSRFAVATVPSEAENPSDDGDGEGNGDDETADETANDTAVEGDDPEVTVTEAALNATDVDVGEPVQVDATIANDRTDAASFTAGLTVDGAVVDTEPVRVPAGSSLSVAFRHVPDAGGSYAVAVNGTTAGTLSVAGEDGGSLLGFLGFLPLGLLKALVTYVGGVVVALFLLLKAVALYLGY